MGSDSRKFAFSAKLGVSIHAPTWGATHNIANYTHRCVFQSTLPHGERRTALTSKPQLMRFQSTLPHGERRWYFRSWSINHRFQSTLPHGERHILDIWSLIAEVSIHAPTWGATKSLVWIWTSKKFQSTLPHGERPQILIIMLFNNVSIHAPTWGATIIRHFGNCIRKSFNPRSHMGSDITTTPRLYNAGVSIHAPTWGATLITSIILMVLLCFNPRSHMGSDCGPTVPVTSAEKFQSTLPHGERLGYPSG